MIAGFIYILGIANDVQIIYILGYNAESCGGSFDEDTQTIIIVGITFLNKVLTQPVVPHSSRLFKTIQ